MREREKAREKHPLLINGFQMQFKTERIGAGLNLFSCSLYGFSMVQTFSPQSSIGHLMHHHCKSKQSSPFRRHVIIETENGSGRDRIESRGISRPQVSLHDMVQPFSQLDIARTRSRQLQQDESSSLFFSERVLIFHF